MDNEALFKCPKCNGFFQHSTGSDTAPCPDCRILGNRVAGAGNEGNDFSETRFNQAMPGVGPLPLRKEVKRSKLRVAIIVIAILVSTTVGVFVVFTNPIVFGAARVESGTLSSTGCKIDIIKINGLQDTLDRYSAHLAWDGNSNSMNPVADGRTTSGEITFIDLNGDGKLSDIDSFALVDSDAGGTPLTPSTSYTFTLKKGNSDVFRVEFTTP